MACASTCGSCREIGDGGDEGGKLADREPAQDQEDLDADGKDGNEREDASCEEGVAEDRAETCQQVVIERRIVVGDQEIGRRIERQAMEDRGDVVGVPALVDIDLGQELGPV